MEDALLELVRNARDAGARNVFVAFTLRRRRYRVLTVIDDGRGVPEPYQALVFEPGVTSRHYSGASAGLSLHHIREAATSIRLTSPANPTAVTAVFDTQTLPERSLQSTSRRSESNIRATLENFHANEPDPPNIHHGSPSHILATLINNRIIQAKSKDGEGAGGIGRVASRAQELGLGLSKRSVRRVLLGEVAPAAKVSGLGAGYRDREGYDGEGGLSLGGVVMKLSGEEIEEITAILRRAAGARYLEIGRLRVESRGGELWMKARVSETEEEYE